MGGTRASQPKTPKPLLGRDPLIEVVSRFFGAPGGCIGDHLPSDFKSQTKTPWQGDKLHCTPCLEEARGSGTFSILIHLLQNSSQFAQSSQRFRSWSKQADYLT